MYGEQVLLIHSRIVNPVQEAKKKGPASIDLDSEGEEVSEGGEENEEHSEEDASEEEGEGDGRGGSRKKKARRGFSQAPSS